jgi:hypothetical protein
MYASNPDLGLILLARLDLHEVREFNDGFEVDVGFVFLHLVLLLPWGLDW